MRSDSANRVAVAAGDLDWMWHTDCRESAAGPVELADSLREVTGGFGDRELLLDKLDPILPFGGPSRFSEVSILLNLGALGRDVPGVRGDKIAEVPQSDIADGVPGIDGNRGGLDVVYVVCKPPKARPLFAR